MSSASPDDCLTGILLAPWLPWLQLFSSRCRRWGLSGGGLRMCWLCWGNYVHRLRLRLDPNFTINSFACAVTSSSSDFRHLSSASRIPAVYSTSIQVLDANKPSTDSRVCRKSRRHVIASCSRSLSHVASAVLRIRHVIACAAELGCQSDQGPTLFCSFEQIRIDHCKDDILVHLQRVRRYKALGS
ncbi:hypothetical protein B0H13DRAFT_2136526 [Mycena leptocephala]|nr:hypothetical protein B0H13DRAFT_2136526 [Mycena leptocephala]